MIKILVVEDDDTLNMSVCKHLSIIFTTKLKKCTERKRSMKVMTTKRRQTSRLDRGEYAHREAARAATRAAVTGFMK